jgi:sulfotransferase
MNLVYNSSLPRSGSTLLQNLLAQNEKNYCSPTSDLIECVVQLRNSYVNFEAFKSQGIMKIAPRIKKAMRGLVEGFYQNEFSEGKTVFDKSRGHMAYIELWEEVLERPVKIICCVRDVRDIVASFEKLFRTNQLTKADPIPAAYFECQTIEGRVAHLLSNEAVVGLAVNRLRDVFDRKVDDRLMIIPYNQLIADPVSAVVQISTFCGSEPFICNPNNVEQKTHEDDSVHGMMLHQVRSKIDNEATRWEDILPERIAKEIHERFPFIQELAGAK